MKLKNRETSVPTSWLLDAILSFELRAVLNPNFVPEYMLRIGDLSDAEINEYVSDLDKNYPGIGLGARDVLLLLRDRHKKQ